VKSLILIVAIEEVNCSCFKSAMIVIEHLQIQSFFAMAQEMFVYLQ